MGDVHAVYLPEIPVNLDCEAARLKSILDAHDCVNIFISEGAGVKDIVAKMEAEGKTVERDAFGHVKLDMINPGKYFADTFSSLIGAEKVLVQKSGVIGMDEDQGDILRCIEFPRIKGHKPFDITVPWFEHMLHDIGQCEKPALASQTSFHFKQ